MTPSPRFTGTAVALAAASDLNDELTVIRNVLAMALQQEEIDREDLLAAVEAARRAEWAVAGLVGWAHRHGAKPLAMTFSRLLKLIG